MGVVCDGEGAPHHRECSGTEDLVKLMEADEQFSIPSRWGANDALGRIMGLEARSSRPSWLRRSVVGVWHIRFRVMSPSEADIFIEITRGSFFVRSPIEIRVPARLEVTGEGCTLTGSLHAESPFGVIFPIVWGAMAIVVAVVGVAASLGGSQGFGPGWLLAAGFPLSVAAGTVALYRLEMRDFVRSSMMELRSRLDVRCA